MTGREFFIAAMSFLVGIAVASVLGIVLSLIAG